jgi:hypothetical protein
VTAPLRDTKTNLYEAAVAAMRDVNEAKAAAGLSRSAERPRTWRLVMLLLGLFGALLLLLQPAWLAGPAAPPPESPVVAAASLRLTLLRERQRVFDYAQAYGRLPTTLTEAGSTRTDLHYQLAGAGDFMITGSAGDSLVTLRSTDSMKLFLGGSLQAIKQRGQP